MERPRHSASLTPLLGQTVPRGLHAGTATPATIVQGPQGQGSPSTSHLFYCPLLPTFPVPVAHSPIPAHPSLVHPTRDLSPLSSTLTPSSSQCQLPRSHSESLLVGGFIPVLDEIFAAAFRHPRVRLVLQRVPSHKAARPLGLTPLETAVSGPS